MDAMIYTVSPEVTFATNIFINVPIILQYDATPMIEVVKSEKAGHEICIPIYHSDGTYLAKVVGSRLFATKDGQKAGVSLRFPQNKTICEMNGKTIFEIHRTGAAALKADAELYCPQGAFIKCLDEKWSGQLMDQNKRPLQIGRLYMKGATFTDCAIGILVMRDGAIAIGKGGSIALGKRGVS